MPAQGDAPNFQNWKAVGAQALVTGRAEAQGGGQTRVEFRLWDVLPQTQIQGTAYTTSQANWRRIAHIIADVIYERLLGEKGYFDTRIVYIAATGPRGRQTKRLAIMDQDSENNRFLTDGSWLVLTPRFHPTRDEIAFMSYANNRPRVYLFNLGNGQQRALGDFPGMTFAPRFSPDGNSVVMSVATGGGSDIVSVDLGSHASRRLTDSGAIDVSPCYSPDGSQIVFNSDRGGDQQLYVMGAGGGGGQAHQLRLRPLCHAGVVAARRPDRLHPVRRRIRQLLDRRDAPGRIGRAHPVGGVLGRGADLRAQRPRADVLAAVRRARQSRVRLFVAPGVGRHHRVQRTRGGDADRRLRSRLVAAGGVTPRGLSLRGAKRRGNPHRSAQRDGDCFARSQ